MVQDLSALGLSFAKGLVALEDLASVRAYEPVGETFKRWVVRSDGTTAGTRAFPATLDGQQLAKSWYTAGERLFLMTASLERELASGSDLEFRRRSLWSLDRDSEEFRRIADLGLEVPRTILRATGRQEKLFLSFRPSYPRAVAIFA